MIQDPTPRDWARVELPGSWVDDLNIVRPAHFVRMMRQIAGKGRPFEVPENLPGREQLPGYLLQEFHHMPNGNYSKRMADAYRKTFDLSMLGTITAARRRIAGRLAGAKSALDLGCGAGDLAGAMRKAGIEDVWALDPCPYLLKEAAVRFPDVRFVQGLAEKTPFPDARFDAVGASFLFHELPAAVSDQALVELGRIMKPGAKLVIIEPSPVQMEDDNLRLLRLGGLSGLYFKLMAKIVFEPYVREWHRKDLGRWFAQSGFELVQDEIGVPMRTLVARKA